MSLGVFAHRLILHVHLFTLSENFLSSQSFNVDMDAITVNSACKRNWKLNVLGKSPMCVSYNFHCTIFTTTIMSIKRKRNHILNYPWIKLQLLIMLFSFFNTIKGHLTSMTNDIVQLICCNVLFLDYFFYSTVMTLEYVCLYSRTIQY